MTLTLLSSLVTAIQLKNLTLYDFALRQIVFDPGGKGTAGFSVNPDGT